MVVLSNLRETHPCVTDTDLRVGVPPAHAFLRVQRKDGSERRHAHAILVFDRPVRGPILLGGTISGLWAVSADASRWRNRDP